MTLKVNVGHACSKSADLGLMVVGLTMIGIGGAVALNVNLIASIISSELAILITVLAIIVGIGMIIASLKSDVDADTIYVDGGYCSVVNTICTCSGGCKTCIFAARYVGNVNFYQEMSEPKK